MRKIISRAAAAMMAVNQETVGLTYSDLMEEMARAALRSLRDPTAEMIEAACLECRDGVAEWDMDRAAPRVFRAMIDVALS